MRKFLYAIVFLTIANTYAQIHFEPGYYIDNQGTRAEVLIKNLDWKNNPVSFEYKASEQAEVNTTRINDVQEFGVGSYLFKKFTVKIDRSQNDTDSMSQLQAPDFAPETLFLKVVATGTVTLYEYEDGNLIRFFAAVENATPEQLIYKPYRDGTTVLYNNAFRGQLYLIMNDKINGRDRYQSVNYNHKSLVKLFNEYNGTTGAVERNATETESKGNSRFHLKFVPGAEMNFAKINQTMEAEAEYRFDNKASLRLGVEAELVLPFNNGKWSLFADPYYSSYKNSGRATYMFGSSSVTNNWTLSYNLITIPAGVRHYMYLNDNAALFISAAYSYAFAVGKSSKATFNYHSSNNTNYTLDADIKNGAGFAFGVGYRYKRYSAEVRYNTNKQLLANYAAWNAQVSSLGIILGYKIF